MKPEAIETAKSLLSNRGIAVKDENLFAFLGEKEVFRALLIMGANPNHFDTYFGAPILSLAFSRNEYAEFKLLLEFGANPNSISSGDRTKAEIIFEMVTYYPSRIRFFTCLIKHKVNLNILHPESGETLLCYKIRMSYRVSSEIIEILLKNGASPNTPNRDDTTVFDWIDNGVVEVSEDIVRLLNEYKSKRGVSMIKSK